MESAAPFTASDLMAAAGVGIIVGVIATYLWYWHSEVKARKARDQLPRHWKPQQR